ncbi:MAG: tRNA (adenosine(37)-N6)-threonylcarbamoyltransferase complex dimerization subunit type 1 TsaB [Eubacteriales bacterium]
MNKDNAKEKLCLCIDTSTKVASVALGKSYDGEDAEILYSVFLNDGLTHSEKLIPLIDQCLNACSISAKDIDLFACVNGPGSFTGLRIGISTANALAQSTGKHIAGVASLETLAYTFRYFDGIISPMIDARRDNIFTALFEGGKEFKQIEDDDIKSVDELLEHIKNTDKKIIFVGDGAEKAKDRAKMMFADRAYFADGISNCVNASDGLQIALKRYFSEEYKKEQVLLPNYVKGTSAKTQAERNAK